MDPQQLSTQLRQFPFAANLQPRMIEHLAASANLRQYGAGQTIFREGQEQHELMFVSSGRVALDVNVPGRGTVRILSLEAGSILGWSAVLGAGQMTTSAVAVEPSEVIAVPSADLLELCTRDPALGYEFMREMALSVAQRLVATRLQLLDVFENETPPISTQVETPRDAAS